MAFLEHTVLNLFDLVQKLRPIGDIKGTVKMREMVFDIAGLQVAEPSYFVVIKPFAQICNDLKVI